MCLRCPDCGCNMKNELVWSEIVPVQRCWKVDHSGCGEKKSLMKSHRCPKQRLVLPLVDRTNDDTPFSFIHTIHPLLYCWWFCLLTKSLTHCCHSRESIFSFTFYTRVGGQLFLDFLLILDQIIPSLHSFVSTFIRYCLSMIDTLWLKGLHGDVHTLIAPMWS